MLGSAKTTRLPLPTVPIQWIRSHVLAAVGGATMEVAELEVVGKLRVGLALTTAIALYLGSFISQHK